MVDISKVTVFYCGYCNAGPFRTKGEYYMHHFKTHKRINVRDV